MFIIFEDLSKRSHGFTITHLHDFTMLSSGTVINNKWFYLKYCVQHINKISYLQDNANNSHKQDINFLHVPQITFKGVCGTGRFIFVWMEL